VVEIDGNDIKQVVDAFDKLPPPESNVPTIIIANTIKGKGVSFIENNPIYHHLGINDEQLAQALEEVDAAYQQGMGGLKA
jgi:transketolase